MNRTKKKKRRSVSFLIVPDDHAEPIVFKFSAAALRVLVVVAALLLVHVVAGGVFYFLYFQAHKENVALHAEKARLENENRKVRVIARKLQDLQQFTKKLKVSLGIEAGAGLDEGKAKPVASARPGSEVRRDYYPLPQSASLNLPPDDRFRRVTAVKTAYHLVYENLPTLLPVDGLITLGFHAPNYHEGSSRKLHLGVDIAARRGSVIKAAGSGTIVFAGWTPDLGNLIIIYHGNDLFTYYAHNTRILKKSGHVRKGEPIALLGSSGETSSGPHLHFEIWRNGVPVDPKEYLFALQEQEPQPTVQ